ncbi:epoxide hydrolase 4-like [Bradysia coprophila]|uniref:epoxide hydrolase 4-like n=1 Tax=Bradysia coprophila TaxID=38358 RepID=UPI00187DD61B|nr:epoxide hydrolase 4-like [Bradysia coprophila]
MIKQISTLILAPFMFFVTKSLCLFYSSLAVVYLVIKFLKYDPKFWNPKVRTHPPACLSNPEFGTHNYIRVNGIKLHYVEKGDKSKPLMLFVHGFPEFWYSWRFQLKEFSNDYWCVAIDMRGYGDSDKPEGISSYEVDQLSDDIKSVIKELGREKCYLICHDWGAVVGWNFVQNNMNMVEKYVMMGAPSAQAWRKVIMSSEFWDQFKKSWYIFYFQMPRLPEFTISLNDFAVFKAVGSKQKSDTYTDEDMEAYKYTFSRPGALTPPINYYRANISFHKMPKLTTPTTFASGLYLLGEDDLYISKATGAELQKFFKNLQYEVVPGTNHFLQQDAPEKTNAIIRKFLKS